MSPHYGMLVESMVSLLLLLTILYCVRLNGRLRMLRADEQSLRATIAELITATEIAERAIGGLKATMREGEETLSARLGRAEQLSAELEQRILRAEAVLDKITRIAGAARSVEPPASVPDARAVAAAAQAFAERARARLSGLAA